MFPSERAEHWKVYKWIGGTVERRATIKAATKSELPPSLRPSAKPHIVYSWSLDPDYQDDPVPQAVPPHVPKRPQIEGAKYVSNGTAPFGSPARDVMRR
ncbi:hypothetical protein ACMFMF_011891, partial [Clarireedia jacksonii]